MKSSSGPMPFQGNMSKRRYFEGWYLKHVSRNRCSIRIAGEGKGEVVLVCGREGITCRVDSSRAGLLKAPDQGGMSLAVKESVNASVSMVMDYGKGEKVRLEGHSGGFEQRGILDL